MDDQVERHTTEFKASQEAAEPVMRTLQQKGWEVFHELVPLTGQAGYYCVRTLKQADGTEVKHAHSIRWNRFHGELTPVTIDALEPATLLEFLFRHAIHEYFDYFEYGDGDVGLVCYCNQHRGWSDVLRVSDEFDHCLDETCAKVLSALADR